jgi:hypothetical protein
MIVVMVEQDTYQGHQVIVRTVSAHSSQHFLCPVCRAKVAYLDNAEVTEMTPTNGQVNIPALFIRHSGALGNGNGHCRIKYYFAL